MAERPKARDDVVFRPLGREWVLYDPGSRKVHVLNATAALVWELCDGEHDAVAMARALRQTVADPPDDDTVREDVADALATFRDEGLLR